MKTATLTVNLRTSQGLFEAGTVFHEPFPPFVIAEIAGGRGRGTVRVETSPSPEPPPAVLPEIAAEPEPEEAGTLPPVSARKKKSQ